LKDFHFYLWKTLYFFNLLLSSCVSKLHNYTVALIKDKIPSQTSPHNKNKINILSSQQSNNSSSQHQDKMISERHVDALIFEPDSVIRAGQHSWRIKSSGSNSDKWHIVKRNLPKKPTISHMKNMCSSSCRKVCAYLMLKGFS